MHGQPYASGFCRGDHRPQKTPRVFPHLLAGGGGYCVSDRIGDHVSKLETIRLGTAIMDSFMESLWGSLGSLQYR
jgi:hypothetical protein